MKARDVYTDEWRVVQSINTLTKPTEPHLAIIVSGDPPLLIASGIDEQVADHIVRLHNTYAAGKP